MVMTNYCSCLHRAKFEKLKQHKEGLIHHQGSITPECTRGEFLILSPRGTFKERTDQSSISCGQCHPITKPHIARCSFVLFTEQLHLHHLIGFSSNFVQISIVAFTDEEIGMQSSSVLSMITQLVRGKAKIRISIISHKQSTPKIRARSPTLDFPGIIRIANMG